MTGRTKGESRREPRHRSHPASPRPGRRPCRCCRPSPGSRRPVLRRFRHRLRWPAFRPGAPGRAAGRRTASGHRRPAGPRSAGRRPGLDGPARDRRRAPARCPRSRARRPRFRRKPRSDQAQPTPVVTTDPTFRQCAHQPADRPARPLNRRGSPQPYRRTATPRPERPRPRRPDRHHGSVRSHRPTGNPGASFHQTGRHPADSPPGPTSHCPPRQRPRFPQPYRRPPPPAPSGPARAAPTGITVPSDLTARQATPAPHSTKPAATPQNSPARPDLPLPPATAPSVAPGPAVGQPGPAPQTPADDFAATPPPPPDAAAAPPSPGTADPSPADPQRLPPGVRLSGPPAAPPAPARPILAEGPAANRRIPAGSAPAPRSAPDSLADLAAPGRRRAGPRRGRTRPDARGRARRPPRAGHAGFCPPRRSRRAVRRHRRRCTGLRRARNAAAGGAGPGQNRP